MTAIIEELSQRQTPRTVPCDFRGSNQAIYSFRDLVSGDEPHKILLFNPVDPTSTWLIIQRLRQDLPGASVTLLSPGHLVDSVTRASGVSELIISANDVEPFRDMFFPENMARLQQHRFDTVVIPETGVDPELNKRMVVLSDALLDHHVKVASDGSLSLARSLRRLRSVPYNNTFAGSGRCDLKCIMCASGDRRTDFGGDLPFELFERTLPMLRSGQVAFVLNGEPFVNPETPRMIHEVKKRNIYTTTTTTANMIDRDLARYLVGAGLDEMRISINADHARLYEKIMCEGRWVKMIAALKHLRDAKRAAGVARPDLVFIMVGMKMNIHTLPGITRLAGEYGVSKVIINPFMPNDRVKRQSLLEDLPLLRRYYGEATAIGAELGVAVTLDEAAPYKHALFGPPQAAVVAPTCDGEAKMTRICSDPWMSIHVMETGIIFPCCGGVEVTFGDLRNQDLSEIWNDEAYVQLRDEVITGNLRQECKDCEMRSWGTPRELYDFLYQRGVRSFVD